MRTTILMVRFLPSLAIAVALSGHFPAVAQEPPANAPAAVQWNAETERLALTYHGRVIFDATITAVDAEGKGVKGAAVRLDPAETRDQKEKVEQRLKSRSLHRRTA